MMSLIEEEIESTSLKQELEGSWRPLEFIVKFRDRIDEINKLLEYCEIEGTAIIQDNTMIVSYGIERVLQCDTTVCIDTKTSSWSDAENEAYLLKRVLRREAVVDYDTDKPHIIIKLRDTDKLVFRISGFDML